ncbi:hypothetical protein BDFB_003039 [Asbolus verrucosus]|uniref:Protein quiver n=1 Tax=Asbolus verrucosus TaxID=1661398 RepID=A0A482VCG9_ASBVE|nr:hypothetical protein BDFB_003039 [Asbolus verrucosus]
MKRVLIVVFLICFCKAAVALWCYTCSVGEEDVDTACIYHPEQVTKTDCNKKYCTIVRQEYKNPPEKIASMFRGCQDYPLFINNTIEDATYRIYYTACQDELCNDGSGKLPIKVDE